MAWMDGAITLITFGAMFVMLEVFWGKAPSEDDQP